MPAEEAEWREGAARHWRQAPLKHRGWGHGERHRGRSLRPAGMAASLKIALAGPRSCSTAHACRRRRDCDRRGARGRADRGPRLPRPSRSRSASPKSVRTADELLGGDRQRSRCRRRDPAHRPLAFDARQEDRHRARLGLRRGQEARRRVRYRGVLRYLAARQRAGAAFPACALPRLLGERPHHAVRQRAGRHDGRPGDDHRQAVRRRRYQCGEGECAAAGHAGGALRRGVALGEPRSRRELAGGAEQDRRKRRRRAEHRHNRPRIGRHRAVRHLPRQHAGQGRER